ncbi:hypothetical protein HDU97_010023 [Phlyctochytrium planicorne]|nr:hypothetical protein HDU97_010023 [Phlyctochytrium planicorne]
MTIPSSSKESSPLFSTNHVPISTQTKPSDSTPDAQRQILDLLVIGAGPHALSLLSHLLERSPFALLSDAQHQRVHVSGWKAGIQKRGKGPVRNCCPTMLDPEAVKRRIMVVDADPEKGGWMERWKGWFEALEIGHLRSPIYFHPDPSNFTQNDRNQFHTPSHHLFSDFCDSLVDRYFLHDILHQGTVTCVEPVFTGDDDDHYFKVTVVDGLGGERVVEARRVVAAVGNTNVSMLPEWVEEARKGCFEKDAKERIVHALELVEMRKKIGKAIPDALQVQCTGEDISTKRRLLVVGGGLTSAQLVELGIQNGFDEASSNCIFELYYLTIRFLFAKNLISVWFFFQTILISRSKLKTMQFDLSLDWIGRNGTILHSKFWREQDPNVRREILRKAKNGGSITPEYMQRLRNFEASNKLIIRECTHVKKVERVDDRWKVLLWNGRCESEMEVDLIWLGTGSSLDIRKEKCFERVVEMDFAKIVGGLPELTKDLQWPKLNLFLMSGYSGLAIGPTAGNLHGGRAAAERIASVLWEAWIKEMKVEDNDVGEFGVRDAERRFCAWMAREVDRKEGKPDLQTLAGMAGGFVNYWDRLVD